MLSFRRDIVPEDAPKIRQMLSGTHFFDESADEIDVAVSLVDEVLARGNNVENYRIIIAEEDSQMVGYVCFARVPCTISTYEMYWLCVDRTLQSKGIGRAILDEVLKEVASNGGLKVVLQTAGRAQYIPTQKFYLKCGFVEEARIKDYYAEGDDCLIYSLECHTHNG